MCAGMHDDLSLVEKEGGGNACGVIKRGKKLKERTVRFTDKSGGGSDNRKNSVIEK